LFALSLVRKPRVGKNSYWQWKIASRSTVACFKLLEEIWTMSVEQRFERLMEVEHLVNALSVCVTRLRSEAQKQVAAIRESIADGERRKAASTWDGKQPDLWLKNGRLWRKPTEADIGKAVRVGHFGADPADMDAVKLVGFHQEAGQHEGFICEGSKGNRVLWPLSWIEFEPDEDPGESGKTHISVQIEGNIQVDEAGWLATVSDDVFQGIAGGWFGTQEKPFDPINDPAPIYRKGQCRLMSEEETIEPGDFFWRNADQSRSLANFTIGMKVKNAVARGRGYNELWVFYRPIEATQSDKPKEASMTVDAYQKLVQSDSDFAWTVFCNLAVMAQDAGAPHKESYERAADLMRNWFGVDVRKFVQWVEPEATTEDSSIAGSDYRDATPEDIAEIIRSGEPMEALFRDADDHDWEEGKLLGWRFHRKWGCAWLDGFGPWRYCLVRKIPKP
jgi:hypothetical protein